jgi:hypothetical protein
MGEHSGAQETRKDHPAPVYRFRVDKQLFESHERYLTGAAILTLAGLDPSLLILSRPRRAASALKLRPIRQSTWRIRASSASSR